MDFGQVVGIPGSLTFSLTWLAERWVLKEQQTLISQERRRAGHGIYFGRNFIVLCFTAGFGDGVCHSENIAVYLQMEVPNGTGAHECQQ